MENLSNRLEILLATYNRVDNLRYTLEQLFTENSPVKNISITILDNNSDDGTSELIDDYARTHTNLKHIKNNRNIGGNPNIARCFEYASAEYFWVLCDDDVYHWENWTQVEEGINKNADCIFVCNTDNPTKNTSCMLCQGTFTPSCIWKSALLNQTVMSNIYYNTSFYFPHIAMLCEVINRQGNIFFCKDSVVINGLYEQKSASNTSFTRGYDNSLHPFQAHTTWAIGFLQAASILKDRKLYNKLFDELRFFDGSKKLQPKAFLETNFDPKKSNNDKRNKAIYVTLLPAKYKPAYVLWNTLLTAKFALRRLIRK